MAKNKKIEGTEKLDPSELRANKSFVHESSVFDDLDGEVFAGLNILRLKEGEVGGPFVLKEILEKQKLGTSAKRKPVDVYVAMSNNVEIRMPVAAGFVTKAKAAKLSEGDEFWVRRVEDYVAKKFGKNNCASYEIKVTKRA